MDKNEYLSVIEGMLYIYGDEGVTIKDVAEALEITKKEAYELMDELLSYYASKTVILVVLIRWSHCLSMMSIIRR